MSKKRKYDGSCILVYSMTDDEIDEFFRKKAEEGVKEATPWFDDGPGMRVRLHPDGTLEGVATGFNVSAGMWGTRSLEDFDRDGYKINRDSF